MNYKKPAAPRQAAPKPAFKPGKKAAKGKGLRAPAVAGAKY
jgi:hypothetical protein